MPLPCAPQPRVLASPALAALAAVETTDSPALDLAQFERHCVG